tara:strand:- start:8449 stop:9084 length:636 start_codon:yes stop_codon:yes gene_type:complete
MTSKHIKISIFLFLFLFTLLTCLNPVYPENQLLQHLGTFIISIILIYDIKKDKLSITAFSLVAVFILFHVIGARWIYTYVPYQDFFSSYFPGSFSEFFETKRNHYDRFVHFIFGVLFIPFLHEIFIFKFKRNTLSLILAWLSIQSFSMLYELFEWSLTVIIDPLEATKYNGQQEDFFDSQKDMALAMLGSTIISMVYLSKGFQKLNFKNIK